MKDRKKTTPASAPASAPAPAPAPTLVKDDLRHRLKDRQKATPASAPAPAPAPTLVKDDLRHTLKDRQKAAALPVSAPAASPSAPYTLLPACRGGPPGKDKATWGELTPHEVQAATALGFDARLWDRGRTPNAANHPWSALPPQLRKAAAVLGYTSHEWNTDGGFEELPAASPLPVAAPADVSGSQRRARSTWTDEEASKELSSLTALGVATAGSRSRADGGGAKRGTNPTLVRTRADSGGPAKRVVNSTLSSRGNW